MCVRVCVCLARQIRGYFEEDTTTTTTTSITTTTSTTSTATHRDVFTLKLPTLLALRLFFTRTFIGPFVTFPR